MSENKLGKKYSALQSKVDLLENEIKDLKKSKEKRIKVGEFINLICSIIATVVAVFGIFLTLYISNEQKKVDLFEKRYEILSEISAIATFVKDYNQSYRIGTDALTYIYDIEKGIQGIPEGEYYRSLWEGRFMDEQDAVSTEPGEKLKSQRWKIEQIPYLFEGISEIEIDRIISFFDIYELYTLRYVQFKEGDYYVQIEEAQIERLECTIDDILLKLEEQTKIK